MKKNNDEFPLTIPSNNTFVHQAYIHSAKLLKDNHDVLESLDPIKLEQIIKTALRYAEFECLKWNELLEWGLAGVNPNDVLKEQMEHPDESENMNMIQMYSKTSLGDQPKMN